MAHTPEAKVNERKPPRWVYLLLAGVFLLGTLMVAAGTHESTHGKPDRSLSETCPPLSATSQTIGRAAAVERMQCAGCHTNHRREIGPSYAAIAGRYRCHADELSIAVGHPMPGWADYPPGPEGPPFAPDDKAALAIWILTMGVDGNE